MHYGYIAVLLVLCTKFMKRTRNGGVGSVRLTT